MSSCKNISGDELYREKRDRRIQEQIAAETAECSFVPQLPGQDSFIRQQLRSGSFRK